LLLSLLVIDSPISFIVVVVVAVVVVADADGGSENIIGDIVGQVRASQPLSHNFGQLEKQL
jgi:hypothetical protein